MYRPFDRPLTELLKSGRLRVRYPKGYQQWRKKFHAALKTNRGDVLKALKQTQGRVPGPQPNPSENRARGILEASFSQARTDLGSDMPPPAVKTIRDLIYWEYAKLISGRAVGDRQNYRFVMYTFKRLRTGRLHPSDITRENKLLVETCPDCCAYCGAKGILEWEHIIPLCKNGPDNMDNQVRACQACNAAKAGRNPFEWYGLARRYQLPRIVLGKYLKLVYEFHERQGTLDRADLNRDGKLDVYDLGVMLQPVGE